MRNSYIVYIILVFHFSCTNSETKLFEKLSSFRTGIDFENNLTFKEDFNIFTYRNYYNGGGVGLGDINNDGLLDIYFTSNLNKNKLYLNKGDFQFEDITDVAGVGGEKSWSTGVSLADINADGFLDIYVSVAGLDGVKNNELYVNNKDNTFTEMAKEYGIDDIGNSVQATFFDYDKDGDLDLYVANYPMTPFDAPRSYYYYKMQNSGDFETDNLYRNDGATFTRVTEEAGLRTYGLTLSATVGDLNNDSYPDLYISNDFSSPDFMYMNNGDGT